MIRRYKMDRGLYHDIMVVGYVNPIAMAVDLTKLGEGAITLGQAQQLIESVLGFAGSVECSVDDVSDKDNVYVYIRHQ